MDPYDYMVAEGLERIQRTLDRYPIADTICQDVISFLPGLADHSPASPSSFEKQRQGVQLLVDRFAQDGINVSSEGLTEHATRMGMGWFFDGLLLPSRPDADMGFPFDTEEVIPLLQFVLHGKSLYSASLCCGATTTVVDNLIMGAGSRAVLDPEDSRAST